ncbi:miniconductance mechanosensitive channel MscM [Oceanisphaera psychrotolerans]|uniref:Mechanosensitive ion channel protein MscS n=1 Tax=Oceanisphaera psychrotolerans TaxID=1414654 RepID=A0A1J4QIG2_9GAMM|nr:miniconductance mechanosensitive channel MscM [Oceanisphaera psychrotolerans]OIN13543.1 mechanosensitive ion channel protein MscS [Oceanisphaera psychrotolerans]
MFAPILLLLALLLPAPLLADQSVADIEALLSEVPEGDKPELKKLRDNYNQALQLVREGERYKEQTKSLKKFMDEYPAELKKLEQQQARLKPTDTGNISQLDEEGVQQALVEAQARRLELRRQREELTNALNLQELSNSGLHNLLDDLRQQLRRTQQNLDEFQFVEAQGRQHTANRILAMAREQSLQRRIQALELEQLSSGNRDSINRLKLDILQRQIQDQDAIIEALQQRQNELRRATTEAAIAESDRLLDEVETDSLLLAEQQAANQRLSGLLSEKSREVEALQLEYQAVERAASELADMKANLKEQLEWLQVSRGFGENLRNRLSELPAPYSLPQLEARIVQSRVDKYGYQESLDNLRNNSYRTELLLSDKAQGITEQQRQQIDELLDTQRRLLERLISATDNQIHEQTRLKVAYSRQNSQLQEIRALTDERLFWLPDLRPVGSQFPAALMETLGWLLTLSTWTALPQTLLQQSGASLTLYGLSSVLVLYLWILSRRSLRAYLDKISAHIGNVTQDRYDYTFNTLLLSLLTAMPIPALLSLLGNAVDSPWAPQVVVALSHALHQLMLPVFILLFAGNLMMSKGLLVVHFNLPVERVRRVWRQFQTLMLALLPALLMFYVAQDYRDFSLYDTLGRLSFIVICLLTSLFSWRLYQEDLPLLVSPPRQEHLTLVNHILWGLLIVAPLLALVATVMGYLFTAHTLLRQLEISVLVGMSFLMFYYLVRRWMLIQRRRLAFERAKARRAEIIAQRKEKEDTPETQTSPEAEAAAVAAVDLDIISAQSLGLLRSALMLGYILSLMLLWSEINTAFSFLDSIEVWQVSSSLAGEDTLVPISLKDLVIALFVVVLTWITARNLPGLMELSLLQHLNLSPGTGFAITTISKYLVLMIGAFTTFAMLGIDWSKTQWLVAALSVGLGFGLQEIFANFVSGLIILFEKPIRIGDTVTIRELTGTVSKIKTRATTIVDWDRREIIVPNKAFITEQFVNWSLSDAITRVKLLVRVRLDADIELVQQITQEAIRECSRILDNPVPEVFLVELTDSALVYEVRVYVEDMSHRMPMTHELHNLLLTRLRRHDIRIPHQQVDIRLLGEQPILPSSRRGDDVRPA